MNKIVVIVIALAAMTTGILAFEHFNSKAYPEHALYYQEPRELKTFSLVDHHGNSFTNQQLEGKWSWIFFGYTSCPDVCPTTLQELNFSYEELKAVTPNTQVLLVSVDPQRDTVERLSQYISYFNSEFKALTADHASLFPFARNLGLMYAINDQQTDENYLVDHSASIVLINPQGKITAIFKPVQEVGQLPIVSGEQLVSDFNKIVNLES